MTDSQHVDNKYLDNEATDNTPATAGETSLADGAFFDEPKRSSVALVWRLLALALALVVIAVLAYPLIQTTFQKDTTAPAASPVTPSPATPLITENKATSPEEWFELGKEYYKQNQWPQAAAAFQKVLELDPSYQAAYANLGAVYHRQDRLDLAVAQYEKALELNPDDGEVVYNLAAVYIQQAAQGGDQPDAALLNQAIEQLNRALELSPNSAEPYFGLGVAYTALNQPEAAVEAFESFLARDEGNDPRAKQEAERYLEFLRSQ